MRCCKSLFHQRALDVRFVPYPHALLQARGVKWSTLGQGFDGEVAPRRGRGIKRLNRANVIVNKLFVPPVSWLMFGLEIALGAAGLPVGIGAIEVEYRCCSRWAFVCSADNGATEFRLPYSPGDGLVLIATVAWNCT